MYIQYASTQDWSELIWLGMHEGMYFCVSAPCHLPSWRLASVRQITSAGWVAVWSSTLRYELSLEAPLSWKAIVHTPHLHENPPCRVRVWCQGRRAAAHDSNLQICYLQVQGAQINCSPSEIMLRSLTQHCQAGKQQWSFTQKTPLNAFKYAGNRGLI